MTNALQRGFAGLLMAVGFLIAPGEALARNAPAAAPVRAPPVPLLWKVSAGEGREMYLLGSFHLLKEDDYPLSDDVEQAFNVSQRLLFELSPEEMNSPELAATMMQAAIRHDGKMLKDDLDADTWSRLQAYAASNGLPLDRLAGMKPWFIGLTVSIAQMTKQGMDPQAGLDRYLMRRAKEAGKSGAGLESAASQIALLDGMSAVEQRQLLGEALEQVDKGDVQSARLHDAWRRGDDVVLWKDMAQQMKRSYPQLYQRINVDRNNAWLPQLERQLKAGQGPTLVVVGALHLLGSDGVVEKLRGKGYAVERVCSVCTPTKKSRR